MFPPTPVPLPPTSPQRNGSNYYDGVFNMDTGADVTQLGRLHFWNDTNTTAAFQPPCNMINGSAGELFHPRRQRDFVDFYSVAGGNVALWVEVCSRV